MPSKAASSRTQGHAAHIRSTRATGLPGAMQRPIKITMLGAGSAFTHPLMNDVLRIPNGKGGTIALVDIDPKRLRTMHELIKKLIAALGVRNWKLVATTDRTKALRGSDYIVNCIEVSGTACVRIDND